MRKLLAALLLNCALFTSICADVVKVDCNVYLEHSEYTFCDDEVYIKTSVMKDIMHHTGKQKETLKSYEAWHMLEFHLFIYVECPNCHALHLVDHGCTNPNCPGNL